MRLTRTPLLLALASPLWLAACSPSAPPPADTAADPAQGPATAIPEGRPTPGDSVPSSGLSPDAVTAGSPAPDAAAPASGGATTPVADATATPAAPTSAGTRDVRQRIDQVLGDSAQYETVFNAFQKAVNGGDRAAVVEEVRFPLNIANGAKITGPGEFQRNYERILTPAVRKAIAAQKFDDVMVNQQGVMIGDGQVWLNGTCLDQACSRTEVKVVTIQ
ncbi:hypothetical protein [Stenotrophomonas rhizophila]|uniref:Lipoprotein n=1 Tax=Stenotrophomonas rhizophila TaxID=216778 RepID=A0AAW5PPJ3_9GAMM|nr:hypothetical protein [Stenotrophomonas rhizophila]MCS4281640.1 hypothetical protein [Stenotrophomonas rhizophila]